MLTSELEEYLYAKTNSFEAVALPCNCAYLVVLLPAPGRNLMDLEHELVQKPERLDAALKRRLGKIDLPPFRIRSEANYRPLLEKMGIRQIFKDLPGIVKIPNSYFDEINQKAGIEVDQEGIRADAETVGGGVLQGEIVASESFHMKLNRPFLFLVRDKTTNALLFIGAVMDPTQN